MFSRRSDEEFIANLRRQSTQRQKMGVGIALVGVIIVIVVTYFTIQVHNKALALTDTLSKPDPNEDQTISRAANALAYSTGLTAGFALASGGLGGITLFVHGAYLLWGYRKESLLLQYHEKINEDR